MPQAAPALQVCFLHIGPLCNLACLGMKSCKGNDVIMFFKFQMLLFYTCGLGMGLGIQRTPSRLVLCPVCESLIVTGMGFLSTVLVVLSPALPMSSQGACLGMCNSYCYWNDTSSFLHWELCVSDIHGQNCLGHASILTSPASFRFETGFVSIMRSLMDEDNPRSLGYNE